MRSLYGAGHLLLAMTFSVPSCGKEARPERGPAPMTLTHAAGLIGQPAPDIDGEDVDGQRFRLADYRGQILVLHFWGHW